jgi:sugar phosphate isomerase/epimerase
MGILGSEGLILSLHRLQENRSNDTRAAGQFVTELKRICDIAGSATVYLQHHPHRNPNFTPWQSGTDAIESLLKIVDLVDRRNFKLAINLGHLNLNVDEPVKLVEMMGDKLGLILLSSNSVDTFGQIYDTHSPISEAGCDLDWIKDIQVPVILDAVYTDFNEEYEDLSLFT